MWPSACTLSNTCKRTHNYYWHWVRHRLLANHDIPHPHSFSWLAQPNLSPRMHMFTSIAKLSSNFRKCVNFRLMFKVWNIDMALKYFSGDSSYRSKYHHINQLRNYKFSWLFNLAIIVYTLIPLHLKSTIRHFLIMNTLCLRCIS